MLTSEEEAKSKWCPQSRAVIYQPGQGLGSASPPCNRQQFHGRGEILLPEATSCIGSGCMFWHWQGWKTNMHSGIAPNPPDEVKDGPRLGYCGLAGEPDRLGPR